MQCHLKILHNWTTTKLPLLDFVPSESGINQQTRDRGLRMYWKRAYGEADMRRLLSNMFAVSASDYV